MVLNEGEDWMAWDTAEISSDILLPPGQLQSKLAP